jgi:hypothetical protein
MKKSILSLIFGFFLTFSYAFGQCPSPTNAGVNLMLKNSYQVGTVASGQTTIQICYDNTTNSIIRGLQFRINYDANAFDGIPVVRMSNASYPFYLDQNVNQIEGYINIAVVYTGTVNNFNFPSGEMFEIDFIHSQNFWTFTPGPISFSNTFPNLAATNFGNDTILTTENFGGFINPVQFTFRGQFLNVDGPGSKDLTVGLMYRPQGGNWSLLTTQITDIDGRFSFLQNLDTTYYNVKLSVLGDTLSVGNIISTADAQKASRIVTQQDLPIGFDFYSADVNGDNNISTSDTYLIFSRIANSFTSWVNGVKDILFFTPSEFTQINSSTTNLRSSIPGITNIDYEITSSVPDSVTFYTLVVGDVNQTGYNMARIVPIEIVNPNNASQYIIDETVVYDNVLESIEVRLPEITVEQGNLVNIPVSVVTEEKRLGSLQIGFKYDPTLLEFKGIQTEETSGRWISFLNPNNNEVLWGGFDVSVTGENNLIDNERVFSLQFLAKEPQSDWDKSPLYVTKKFVGNQIAKDLNIIPTNGRVQILVIGNPGPNLLRDIESSIIYPNPTDGQTNVKFNLIDDTKVSIFLMDIDGKIRIELLNSDIPAGQYKYNYNLGHLKPGLYFLIVNTPKTNLSNKLIITGR